MKDLLAQTINIQSSSNQAVSQENMAPYLIRYILSGLFFAGFIAVIIAFIYGLIILIKSRGDKKKRDKGLNYTIGAVMCFFTILFFWALLNVIFSMSCCIDPNTLNIPSLENP